MKCRAQEPSAQSLLEFMDTASDAVKCALKKPASFKRNINHRRYLQRQVKTVVRSRRPTRKINPCDLKEDVQDLVREAIKELRVSQYYTNSVGHDIGGQPPQPYAYARNLTPTYRLTHLPRYTSYENPLHKNNSCFYSQVNPVSPNTDEEDFMSGEELTNNIDINDLYIPELHEPRSPIVNCEDYFVENELEIPSPLYDEQSDMYFQFDPCVNLRSFEQFL